MDMKAKKLANKIKGKELVLSKPQRIASAQALRDLGFSVREVARILGVDPKTVLRYSDKELDKEWEQFANMVKKVYLQQDFELTQLAVRRIKKKINKARFYELVGLLKVVRELQREIPQQQINIAGKNLKVEFIKEE